MHEATVVTDKAAVQRRCRTAPPTARIPVEVRLPVDDPFDAYRRARRGDGGDALLETTGGQPGWGYFATDPVDRLTVWPDAAVRDDTPARGHRADFANPSPSLSALAGLLDGETVAREEGDVPYPCGAIGWLSYDVARELESLPAATVDDRGLPHLQVNVYDRIATWEEPRDGETTLRITACPRLDDCDGDPAVVYERGVDRAMALVAAIREGDAEHGPAPVARDDVTFESDCGRAAFADRVRRVKAHVRDGDTFQANVSQRLAAPAAVHPVAAYDALRQVNPAPYSCLLEFPGVDLVSASPELLLDVAPRDPEEPDATRRVRTEPIAGTRPRGASEAEDADLEADLTSDEKERAEHAMLVDLERNDLGKVCAYGSVDVAEYRRVDRYSEVMHLVSSVVGDLRPDATTTDAVAATFPGGTITGAPKPRTMELIDEVEATRRGPYTGSVGIFGFDGRATLNIVIRTLVRQAETYHLRVGAGVVHDSMPDREYDETLDKARALVTAVDAALGERAAMEVEE